MLDLVTHLWQITTMELTSNATLTILVVGLGWLLIRFYQTRRTRNDSEGRRLPPGPPRLPVVGNLLDIPKVRPWEVYREMSKKYGT